ncbi:MAG: gluconate 2-dehydrogenase subunit 3 family protein [Balneolaceae bacterium]
MKRRDVLKYGAISIMGAPLLSTVLFGSTTVPQAILNSYNPVFFTPDQLDLLKAITDTILPKTDSPSASEVGVPEKIDHMIPVLLIREDRRDYLSRFKQLETYLLTQANGNDFKSLSPKERFSILDTLSTSSSNNLKQSRLVLWDLKGKTVDYYRKSQIVATEFLNYLPVPGYYDPCISLQEAGGKAWAI